MARHRLDGTINDQPWWWDFPTRELPIVQAQTPAHRVRPYVLTTVAATVTHSGYRRASWWAS
jgi:hypothetical protein